jgi:hypothetical protein
MRLELDDETTIENPSKEEIRSALLSLHVPGREFAILESAPGYYVQVAKNEDGSYALEYQQGSLKQHYGLEDVVADEAEVIDAFLSYASGDDRWRYMFEWRLMKTPGSSRLRPIE